MLETTLRRTPALRAKFAFEGWRESGVAWEGGGNGVGDTSSLLEPAKLDRLKRLALLNASCELLTDESGSDCIASLSISRKRS